jgi:hypothetical protein
MRVASASAYGVYLRNGLFSHCSCSWYRASAMSLTRRGRPGGLRSVPLNDRPSLSFRPFRVIDVVRCTNMVHYDLVEDRFAAVRVARFKI